MYSHRLFVVLFGVLSFSFFGYSQKIDISLMDKYKDSKQAEYIVLLKARPKAKAEWKSLPKVEKSRLVYNQLVATSEVSQKHLLGYLSSRSIVYQSFYVTNAVKVTSDISVMKFIAAFPEVDRIIDNRAFKMLDYSISRPSIASREVMPEWGVRKIKADSVWAKGYTGQGVVIAGQDTGFDWNVRPLKSKYAGYIDSITFDHNYHWHDAITTNNPVFADTLVNPCGFSSRQPCDDHNHGTHTMGTMLGSDEDNQIGVAPGAKWIACRNMDRGWGTPSTYLECFEWFLAPYDLDKNNPDPTKSPDVINNSWYCSETEGCNISNVYLMQEIIQNLKASGIVVVVSAGNLGGQGCGSVSGPPAYIEESFSIGATNSEDTIAGFSSRGPVTIDSSFRLKPNVVAPGVNVRSVVRGGGFANYSGTSMAGPHVAGAVALMISANPKLSGRVEEIENILIATALPLFSSQGCIGILGSDYPNAVYGYGRIDALAAVEKALAFTTEVKETSANKNVNIYPNPTSGLVTFSMSDWEYLENIRILDQIGNVVVTQNIQSIKILHTIDLSALPSGWYIYQIAKTKGTFVGRVFKY